MVSPPALCKTLAFFDRMRVPRPAAKITTLTAEEEEEFISLIIGRLNVERQGSPVPMGAYL
jgi:hypothetical protein